MKPGEDLILKGIADLNEGRDTVESLLFSTGVSRLRLTGLDIPNVEFNEPTHRL